MIDLSIFPTALKSANMVLIFKKGIKKMLLDKRSIIGPLLFNTFLCDLFSMSSNTDYINDNTTPYFTRDGAKEASDSLKIP